MLQANQQEELYRTNISICSPIASILSNYGLFIRIHIFKYYMKLTNFQQKKMQLLPIF